VPVISPPYSLGATGLQHSARLDRLALGASWRPAGNPLAAVGGALWGPPGSMGELALASPTLLNVNPALWVVQGTHSADQGQYLVPNDGLAQLAVTAQHASQFRRNLVAVTVADSQAAGVASSPTTDRAYLHLIEGPLSATSPAPLPAVPANSLLLGEVGIPPTGQPVTATGYNPRTVSRGGIQPVIDDALAVAGHVAEAGSYVGQYRDHPTWGIERWTGGAWRSPQPQGQWAMHLDSGSYDLTVSGAAFVDMPGTSFSRFVPAGRQLEVDYAVPLLQVGAGSGAEYRITCHTLPKIMDGALFSTSSGVTVYTKLALNAHVDGDGRTLVFGVQARLLAGSQRILGAGGAPVRLRSRLN
jgi:hypothetical protein